MKAAMQDAGVDVSGSDAESLCQTTRDWLLGELKAKNMTAPAWKGEAATSIILDPAEWSTDNDMMTPSLKVKLRNLLSHHEAEIAKTKAKTDCIPVFAYRETSTTNESLYELAISL